MEDQKMSVAKERFGTAKNGEEIWLYTLSNANGIQAKVMNYGANLVSLLVPDKNGKAEDVVLGFDTPEGYFYNGSFFGAVIGPSANRIAGASFELDGKVCQLDANDGANNLHSHMEDGYHKRIWKTEEGTDSVTFSLEDQDGAMGFPADKKISLTYSLSAENELKLHYHVSVNKKTIINMTNHSYFNLAGQGKGKIEDHQLQIRASHYTPVVKGAIPTGEIAPVQGTPMDFTQWKTVGQDINADFEQLRLVQGYDHNYVIDDADGTLREIASVKEPVSGREMKVYTDLPGVQFYAGNCIGEEPGKGGVIYGPRMGLCLETQYYPDNIHQPGFPQAVFEPGKDYDSVTIYQFVL